jgi:hypothetical protein
MVVKAFTRYLLARGLLECSPRKVGSVSTNENCRSAPAGIFQAGSVPTTDDPTFSIRISGMAPKTEGSEQTRGCNKTRTSTGRDPGRVYHS